VEVGRVAWEKIKSSVVLESGEELLGGWGGALQSTHQAVRTKKGLIRDRHTVVEAKDWEAGVLALSTQRLIWFKQRGTFGKSYHKTMEIPLEEITGISGSGRILKNVIVSDREGEYLFRLKTDLETFQESVNKALKNRKQALEEIKKKERVHVMIDFSSLSKYMKDGGLSLTTIKCPECDAPLKLPKDGTEIVCKFCNNTILAQDIFQKIKSLIG